MGYAAEATLAGQQAATERAREKAAFSRSYDHRLRRVLATGDGVAVLSALALALVIDGRRGAAGNLAWGLGVLPLMIVLFKLYGLYDRDVKRISHSTTDDLPWLFHAAINGTLLMWLYSKLTPMRQLDFAEVLLFSALVVALDMCVRAVVRLNGTQLVRAERALLVGGGQMAGILFGKLMAHPEYRLNVVGVLAVRPGAPSAIPELPALGAIADLEELAAEHQAARIIVTASDLDDAELEDLLRRCRKLSLKLSLIPKLSDVLGPAVEVDDVEGVTVLGVNPPWLPRSSRAVKRTLDVVVAGALLVIAAPLMALIGVAIKLDSRGPVFFGQRRVGRGGGQFCLYKFRTMVSDAEQRRAELLERSTDPNWLKLDHDPRITRLGRLLRRLSLDELPQLWNVLRGEMSMVGPRPLIEAEDKQVTGWARERLDLTPGLTGYWQVLGRTRIPFEEMVKLDYLYVMNWSLWSDIRLILRTLPALVSGRGAN